MLGLLIIKGHMEVLGHKKEEGDQNEENSVSSDSDFNLLCCGV